MHTTRTDAHTISKDASSHVRMKSSCIPLQYSSGVASGHAHMLPTLWLNTHWYPVSKSRFFQFNYLLSICCCMEPDRSCRCPSWIVTKSLIYENAAAFMQYIESRTLDWICCSTGNQYIHSAIWNDGVMLFVPCDHSDLNILYSLEVYVIVLWIYQRATGCSNPVYGTQNMDQTYKRIVD